MIDSAMRRGCLVVLCALSACGRTGFDRPIDAAPDTGVDLPQEVDAAVPADAAFPTGPFSAPRKILELSSTAHEDDPTLTDDMLEIYFASTRKDVAKDVLGDIWKSTRARVTDPWSNPVEVTELNSASDDQNPGISGDGLTLWFSSNRGGPLDIYVSTRATRAQIWSMPVRVVELSTPVDDLGAEPARGQLRMALYGDNPRRLFEATRPSIGALWSPPVPIDSLNLLGSDNLSGFFVSDLELWFVSTRPGGSGQHDIYRAVRPSVTAPFETPVPVAGLNTRLRDDDPWLSPDGHTVFFTSQDGANQEIYVAERP